MESASQTLDLFRAAPNLDTLIIGSVEEESAFDFDGLKLDKLTYLELRSAMVGADALISIYKLFPNLEIFKYEIGDYSVGYEQFALPDLRFATLNHAKSLTFLAAHESWDRWYEVTMINQNVHSQALEDLEAAIKTRGIEYSFQPISRSASNKSLLMERLEKS